MAAETECPTRGARGPREAARPVRGSRVVVAEGDPHVVLGDAERAGAGTADRQVGEHRLGVGQCGVPARWLHLRRWRQQQRR